VFVQWPCYVVRVQQYLNCRQTQTGISPVPPWLIKRLFGFYWVAIHGNSFDMTTRILSDKFVDRIPLGARYFSLVLNISNGSAVHQLKSGYSGDLPPLPLRKFLAWIVTRLPFTSILLLYSRNTHYTPRKEKFVDIEPDWASELCGEKKTPDPCLDMKPGVSRQ